MAQLIAFSIVGCLILFLCYLIKYKKQANLRSGYDENLIIDKDGLRNWIGSIMMLPGICAIIAGVLLWLQPNWGLPGAILFAAITITAVIMANIGSRKFKKKV